MHYQRLLKHGDPLAGPEYRTTQWGDPQRWIDSHKDYDGDDCIKWPYADDGHGYGHLTYNGKMVKAHRLMCELVNGPPPFERAEAAHSCGNGKRGCVNRNHLRWATAKENNWDKVSHSTDNRGERCGTHKLKEPDVVNIISMLESGISHQRIADVHNVHRCSITDIAKGKNWSWLTGRVYHGNPRPPVAANDNVKQEIAA